MNLVDYKQLKWIWISPLQGYAPPPPLTNNDYTIDSEYVFRRFIQASAYHIDYSLNNQIPLDADIYVIVSFDIGNLEKEIEFAKQVKANGKKLIVCYSADLRFLIGNCLISPRGTLYTELCKYADVILSGTGRGINIYGRYADRVLEWALPLEKRNFSDRPFENRDIDVLISGSAGCECLSFELEFMFMLKEKYPDLKIVHSSQQGNKVYVDLFKDKGITFVHELLIKNLVNAKAYVNLEIRPRGARVGVDAFYCRTPMMLCESTLFSELLPEFSYPMTMHLPNMVKTYEKMRDTDYNQTLQTMEKNAENLYFDNEIHNLMNRLYPE